tara:strand:+ start:5982 stop:7058 length:1077 start_codon:yes stop_codon:yes gene_type:complete
MPFNEFKEIFQRGLNQGQVFQPDQIFSSYFNQKLDSKNKDFFRNWFDQTVNFSELSPFFKNPLHREIIVHSPKFIQIETMNIVEKSITKEIKPIPDLQLALEILCLKEKVDWNYSQPFASFYTSFYGVSFRATLIHFSSLSSKHSKLFLRRHTKDPLGLSNFDISEEDKKFITSSIKNKNNILISGQTGSGKTTFLNTVLNKIPKSEHIIIFEETRELSRKSPLTTSFLADEKSSKKSLVQYLNYALRMKPDRMIMGEIRSKEALNFLLQMNTGHEGMMATIHANSAPDALLRLAWLFCFYSPKDSFPFNMVLKMICQNINLVIHMKGKKIDKCIEVLGSEDETPYFKLVSTQQNAPQ